MVQAVINGLLLGATYALLALGYSLVFGVMHLLTLAHGQIFMASALVALILSSASTPFWVAGLLAIAIGAAMSAVTDLICFRPVGYGRPIAAAVATIGFALVIGSGTLQVRGSSNPVAAPFRLPDADFAVGGVLISGVQLAALGIAVMVMVGTHLFVRRTRWGVAMRAFAHDAQAVRLLGVPTPLLTATTLAIAGGLAGLSSFLHVLRIGSISPLEGLGVGLIGLAVMTIGGLGNLPGAMVAGLSLGLLQSVAAYMGFTGYQAAIPWLLLIVVLLIRPTGRLGGAAA